MGAVVASKVVEGAVVEVVEIEVAAVEVAAVGVAAVEVAAVEVAAVEVAAVGGAILSMTVDEDAFVVLLEHDEIVVRTVRTVRRRRIIRPTSTRRR